MGWQHGVAWMAAVPLVSVALLVVTTSLVTPPDTGTDLGRTAIPVASFLVIHVGIGAAPGIISIAIILGRRRIAEPHKTSGLTRTAKVTVVVLAVWTIFFMLVVGIMGNYTLG